jgi:acetyl esterase
MKLACAAFIVGFPLFALAADKPAAVPIPTPDLADAHYGPHELQVFDLWKARSDRPTPLVVQIHGGGFYTGNKGVPGEVVNSYLQQGVSLMTINYRLARVKFPDHFLDCARAIQFARASAQQWNIDPKRIAATGASAGGTACLWLAFHEDLADPNHSDPVLRQSTRLACVAVHSAGCSLDPQVCREWIGDIVLKHRFFNGNFWGLKPQEFSTPKAQALFDASSPITHLTKDDPPVWAAYGIPKDPLDITSAIHHKNQGLHLQEQMDKLGIECTLQIGGPKRGEVGGPMPFLMKHLEAMSKPAAP